MTTAADTLYCVFCHEPIGDEPAIGIADFINGETVDGVAHVRCFFKLDTEHHDL